MTDLEKEGYVKLPIEDYEDLLRAVVVGEDNEAVIDKLDRKVSNLEYKIKQLQEFYMEEKYKSFQYHMDSTLEQLTDISYYGSFCFSTKELQKYGISLEDAIGFIARKKKEYDHELELRRKEREEKEKAENEDTDN